MRVGNTQIVYHYSLARYSSLKSKALQTGTIPEDQVEWEAKVGGVAPYDTNISFFMSPAPIRHIRNLLRNHPFGGKNIHKPVFEHIVAVSPTILSTIRGWRIAETPFEEHFRDTWDWTDKSDDEILKYRSVVNKLLRKKGLMSNNSEILPPTIQGYARSNLVEYYTRAAKKNPTSTLYAEAVPHLMLYVAQEIPVTRVNIV